MKIRMFFAVSLALVIVGSLLGQKTHKPSQAAPFTQISPDGTHAIHFSDRQQAAINSFLRSHPDLQLANCQALGLAAQACTKGYQEWIDLVQRAKADVQFPFALWGDFNRDGLIDFALPFFNPIPVNNWGWRNWQIVVFQGVQDGSFRPVVAMTDKWGLCFDGMLYHPVRKQIEYWCGSGGGSVRWNGSRYVGKAMQGD